jgi:hypothetical protein
MKFNALAILLKIILSLMVNKFIKFNLFNNLDNVLKPVENESMGQNNIFDKSLKNGYIVIIKELYILHNFFSSTIE